jgi:hypothetical protein
MNASSHFSRPTWFPWLLVAALIGLATAGGFSMDHRVSITSEAILYVLIVVVLPTPWSFCPPRLARSGL